MSEIRHCSVYLKETLDIVRPRYVVPLGGVAIKALHIIHPLKIKLGECLGQVTAWNGCHVYPLFHPGPRALIRRSRPQQLHDYCELAELLGKTAR